MPSRRYVIVGGGLAAHAATHGIRERDPCGYIAVLSDEDVPPYDRAPLSKTLWSGAAVETIWRRTTELEIDLRLRTKVVSIDRSQRIATDQDGRTFGYDALLFATGGSPRRLRGTHPDVIYLRRLSDFKRAHELARLGADFAVVGGGFVGTEIAAALAMNGHKVSLLFPGTGIGDHLFPRPLANFLNLYFRKRGVDVRFNHCVSRIDDQHGRATIRTIDGEILNVDAVIAGIGLKPNVDLAKAAGLDVGNGIIVDETLRTRDPCVFAAGDVANFPCLPFRRHLRIDHERNAEAMGRVAGRNMVGNFETYRALPQFHSNLFDLGYEAVGEIDSRLDIIEDWTQKFYKGILYYLHRNRVRGVLLWNVCGQQQAALDIIASRHKQSRASLIGCLRQPPRVAQVI